MPAIKRGVNLGPFKNIGEKVKNVNGFSIKFFYYGLQLACWLLVLSLIFHLMEGRYGDYITAMNHSKAAYDAALGVAASSFITSAICDIASKDRLSNNK
jgi:hypothetical protein